jgi:hypothetical protein
MFEKWESKSYPNADAKVLHAHALNWWQQNGFMVQEIGPGQLSGKSASKWGLQREVNVTVKDIAGTAVLELRMTANITDEGVIGGGLALVLLWPVAVLGGAYSYAKYEDDAMRLMGTFWQTVNSVAQTAPTDQKEQVIHTTAVPAEEAAQYHTSTMPSAPLTVEEKIQMLEDRLARGEISEETFKEIKQRLQ